MTRSQRRASRALVAAVGATLAVGLVVTGVKIGSRTKAAAPEQAKASVLIPPAPTAPVVTAKSDGAKPAEAKLARLGGAAVLETPTAPVAPATKPPLPLMAGVGEVAASANAAAGRGASATTQPSGNVQVASATHAPSEAGAAKPHVPVAPTVAPASLADAKAQMDAGKLLDARNGLNALLSAGTLSDADVRAAKGLLNQINASVVFSARKFPDDPHGGTFTVPPGGVLQKIANSHEVPFELLMRINGISDPRKLKAGQSLKILKGPFHAVVSKKDFTLELWLGEPAAKSSMYITSFPVGLGKDDSTPTGVWAVANKLKNPTYYSPRGEGVIAADDPRNPLGEYWIGLIGTDGHAVGKQSYGIHGTIDPASIGQQASMGCVRLVNENVQQVFEVLVEGKSTVTVKE